MSQDGKAAEPFLCQFKAYLSAEFGVVNCHSQEGAYSVTIDAQAEQYDIYLRVPAAPGFWPEATLVVACMSFRPPRSGHGQRLLQFLTEQAEGLGFNKIGIETTNENSDRFGRRFGMLAPAPLRESN